MSSICIITARGGSKRIPKKNIKEFCGKPIIAYSIEAALASKLFDEVMVSTDSEEIAAVARHYGAKIPFMRSEKASDDFATTEDVLEEVLEEYAKRNIQYEWFACLYPTAPLISNERLLQAYDLMNVDDIDAVEPVVIFSYPPQRCYVKKSGLIEYKWSEYKDSRSQDLEPYYHDAGQFYFFKTAPFLKMRRNNQELKKMALVLDELEVQDIDNLSDWKLAELKYKVINDA